MKPRGLLMIEHRLIERVLHVIAKERKKISTAPYVDTLFIDSCVDFLKTFADFAHHGKEEGILFKKLKEKNMLPEDNKMMQELITEHIFARKTTSELMNYNHKYRSGETENIDLIALKLDDLINLYPGHIRKEDKDFFPAAEKYFDEKELSSMLMEFGEYDKKVIHEKYTGFVEELEKRYL